MPTNANTFNSRVTSEALERKFRDVFPAQGGAELVQDLYASGVVQPVIDFSSVAEGSVLPELLQTAWDFSNGSNQVNNNTTTIINNPGFWLVDLFASKHGAPSANGYIRINDGATNKSVWQGFFHDGGTSLIAEAKFVVFLRSGDILTVSSDQPALVMNTWWRQIADVNGTLVNPLGFTFS